VAVKLIMTWDISPEHEQEYFEFVIREFLPGMQQLGFELSDAWATVYGNYPQIMVGVVQSSLSDARQAMHSQEWKNLNNKLLDYVVNYTQKIVQAHGGFQY
jgi:hypothetical protein